jgi:two-component system chemotaxis sensor kinase CheA
VAGQDAGAISASAASSGSAARAVATTGLGAAAGLGTVAGPGAAASAGAPAGPGAAPKVLVVEDSFTVRELQRSILETAGYQVVTARDGREAWRSIDRDAGIVLVVADLEMPGLDGAELTRAIRASAAHSSLPVIIVTKHGSDEDKLRGMEAGADAYMTKRSFNQQDLLATIERLIGRS